MPLSKAAGLPVFAIVTQGKTEHLVTIIDEKVLSKLKKGTDFSKLKEETIVIKWHSTGAKQSIKTSSMKLSDMMGGIGGGDGGDSGRRASRRGSLGSAAAVAVVAATAAVTKRKRHAGGSGSMATDDDHDEDGTLKPTKKKRPPTPSKTARKMKVTTTPVRAPSKKMKAQKKTEQVGNNEDGDQNRTNNNNAKKLDPITIKGGSMNITIPSLRSKSSMKDNAGDGNDADNNEDEIRASDVENNGSSSIMDVVNAAASFSISSSSSSLQLKKVNTTQKRKARAKRNLIVPGQTIQNSSKNYIVESKGAYAGDEASTNWNSITGERYGHGSARQTNASSNSSSLILTSSTRSNSDRSFNKSKRANTSQEIQSTTIRSSRRKKKSDKTPETIDITNSDSEDDDTINNNDDQEDDNCLQISLKRLAYNNRIYNHEDHRIKLKYDIETSSMALTFNKSELVSARRGRIEVVIDMENAEELIYFDDDEIISLNIDLDNFLFFKAVPTLLNGRPTTKRHRFELEFGDDAEFNYLMSCIEENGISLTTAQPNDMQDYAQALIMDSEKKYSFRNKSTPTASRDNMSNSTGIDQLSYESVKDKGGNEEVEVEELVVKSQDTLIRERHDRATASGNVISLVDNPTADENTVPVTHGDGNTISTGTTANILATTAPAYHAKKSDKNDNNNRHNQPVIVTANDAIDNNDNTATSLKNIPDVSFGHIKEKVQWFVDHANDKQTVTATGVRKWLEEFLDMDLNTAEYKAEIRSLTMKILFKN